MAASTCVKCSGKLFEVVEAQPHDSRFKLLFVQCAACGGVVGALEHTNVGALIRLVAGKLGLTLP